MKPKANCAIFPMIVCVFCYTADKPLPGKPVAPPVELFQAVVNHYQSLFALWHRNSLAKFID